MMDTFQSLANTSAPSLLIIGGILFLFFAFAKVSLQKAGGQIEVNPRRQGCVGIIGGLLLLMGIGLYIVPFLQPISSMPTLSSTAESVVGGESSHVPTVTVTTVPAQIASSQDCSVLIEREHHAPVLGVIWRLTPSEQNRILHVWSNHWGNILPEYKFFLPAGQSVEFMSGGGSVWEEKPGCEGVAPVIFERDPLKEISLEEYQRYIESGAIP